MKTFFPQSSTWLLLFLCAASLAPWRMPAQQTQDSQELQLVESPPPFGTFYAASSGVPYPFDFSFGKYRVFQWRPGIYIVDDSQMQKSEASASLISAESSSGEMSLSAVPAPCNPCPTNGGGGGPVNFGPVDYSGSNVLWLEIALGTNASTALITLHNTTNGIRYQLLSRPDVDLPPWLVEQTVFGAAGTNTITTVFFNDRPILFYQAGVDTDGDGLVDYWEAILGTDPNSTDTDGDGVSDYVEVIQGRNPNDVNGAVADTTGLINLQVYTPLR